MYLRIGMYIVLQVILVCVVAGEADKQGGSGSSTAKPVTGEVVDDTNTSFLGRIKKKLFG